MVSFLFKNHLNRHSDLPFSRVALWGIPFMAMAMAMASPSERSSSSRSTASLMPGRIVVAFDATRNFNSQEMKNIISNIQMQQSMIQEVDTITVLGVLHKVPHPMGFEMEISPDSFMRTCVRAIKEQVSRMADAYAGNLHNSAEACEVSGVVIEVKIVVGAPLKNVIVQESIASNATWVVLKRHLRKEIKFCLNKIPSKVAQTLDNFSLKILRSFYSAKATANVEPRAVLLAVQASSRDSTLRIVADASSSGDLRREATNEDKESNYFHPKKEKQINLQLDFHTSHHSDGTKTRMSSKGWKYSKIQAATNDFSSDNLLGEDGYGLVYKGLLKDGQLVAVKVQKEANTQGCLEIYSQLGSLRLACHKNVVMLLGYCRRENTTILVYEYICDRSLEWYLFDSTEHLLPWHRRCAIAVGIAKGLRFLHEECRGSPILHRGMMPRNICLTREFVPMLADCGLAEWNLDDQENSEYLAPEYAENCVCSVETEVFALGIILIQLISGLKRLDSTKGSLREWAMPLIQMLKRGELVDPRLGDSYATYEVYQMARVAYLCVQTKRPTVGEVLLILEGENDHLDQLIPVPNSVQRRGSTLNSADFSLLEQ
ncbi:hypothetical protein SASPL_148192 [Salvia splendens]|uniref:non-specific serine/threonine protein kinase n=1 Tax=Salvia splendens TaxID=180675 RepID=A0A8X8W8U0_SALSN|nr:hypothetical protein SASPL_148192 [Salvia splendens]